MNEKVEYCGFSEGMEVIITKKISSWSSHLNPHYHNHFNIEYPYTLKIKKIEICDDPKHVAMTCGDYGWSLSSLIEADAIVVSKKEIRKRKLDKISNS